MLGARPRDWRAGESNPRRRGGAAGASSGEIEWERESEGGEAEIE